MITLYGEGRGEKREEYVNLHNLDKDSSIIFSYIIYIYIYLLIILFTYPTAVIHGNREDVGDTIRCHVSHAPSLISSSA